MTFQPVVPMSGYSGWLFLQRTGDAQREAFKESSDVVRVTDNFREKIGSIQTAEELVNDRELLSVALGAFGLEDDLDNKFFIRKILEEGTIDTDALANKLSDSSYADLSEAFGFGELEVTRTGISLFAEEIIDRYENKQFQSAVGEQDNDMRLALNMAPALDDVIDGNSTVDGQWFAMMGNTPLRTVFETAFGFSSSFAAIDLDQQLDQFKARAESTFGTSDLAELASPENQEKMVRLYLLRTETNAISAYSGASVALSLLSQI